MISLKNKTFELKYYRVGQKTQSLKRLPDFNLVNHHISTLFLYSISCNSKIMFFFFVFFFLGGGYSNCYEHFDPFFLAFSSFNIQDTLLSFSLYRRSCLKDKIRNNIVIIAFSSPLSFYPGCVESKLRVLSTTWPRILSWIPPSRNSQNLLTNYL